mmetsp:Transcript_4334/g.6351  ORF Transcript_4334/g.6351 Transcript_4334/m.6351 type:complete len:267 (-) Transcript_4334:1442-2242(-)
MSACRCEKEEVKENLAFLNIFVLCPDGKTICLEVNPNHEIAKIQNQILEKIYTKKIYDAHCSRETLRQKQASLQPIQRYKDVSLSSSSLSFYHILLSSIKFYSMLLESHLYDFIIRVNQSSSLSLTGANDMYLIYNGKVLCPYNTLLDYLHYNPFMNRPCYQSSNGSSSSGSDSDSSRNNNHNTNGNNYYDAKANHDDTIRKYKYDNGPITIHASFPIKGGCFIVSFSILMTIVMAMCMSVCTCGLSLFAVPILAPFLFILPLFCL